jgi:ribosomal protein L37AE/L43A
MKTIICNNCKSDGILRDAWAVWDRDAQDWVLMKKMNTYVCTNCGRDAEPVEREVTNEHTG